MGMHMEWHRRNAGCNVRAGCCLLCRATANGAPFEDTKARGKPIVFRYGSRPFTGGLCKGVEEALSTMRTGDAPPSRLPLIPLSLPLNMHSLCAQT